MELAVVILVLAIVVLLLVQAALVVRDQVLVVHAARDAARAASVGSDDVDVLARVRAVLPDADVTIEGGGAVRDPLTVEVVYESHTDLPLVGPLLPSFTLRQRVTMRAERAS